MGPLALEDLIVAFAKLPGIGRVTAQRLALYVVKRPREEAELLANALIAAKDQIAHCATCHNFTQQGEDLCTICRTPAATSSCSAWWPRPAMCWPWS